MKKKLSCLISLLGAMLVIVSCSQIDDAENSTEFSNKVADATFRTSDDAALIAMRFSRSSATREAETKSVKSVVVARGSNTRSNDSTLVYAVNFNDDKGYVLVPARKDLPGVLAVIDKGNFNALEVESNPNASFMMDKIGTYVQQGSLRKPSTPPGYYDTIFSGTRTVLPVVDVEWGQKWPENIYCPNKVAGCGPLALVQMMTAMCKPTSVTYTFPEKDLASESINWSELKKHRESTGYSEESEHNCNASSNTHLTIARIVREAGHLADAYYSDAGWTSTYLNKLVYTMSKMTGKSMISSSTSSLSLFNCLSLANRSVVALVVGCDLYEGGHAWVADGTMEIGMTLIYYDQPVVWDGIDSGKLVGYPVDVSKKYIHYNWGWNGLFNGYFLVDVFNPSNGAKYDLPNRTRSLDFAGDFKYVLYSLSE